MKMRKWMYTYFVVLSCCFQNLPLPAATVWNEGSNGDLSNNQNAPNSIALTAGVNSIIGTVGGGNSQDWAALTVPNGHQLVSMILFSYTSTDAQGFTGFQTGSTFPGNVNSAGSYKGYAHFGTGAVNGPFPPTNLVGADILALMANPNVSQGAMGFTPPLNSGSYTFLFQQLGASTNYQFDFTVRAIPEPEMSWHWIVGAVGLVLVARKLPRL